MFIYFSEGAIRRVVEVMADCMPEPADLCVGASESLLRITDRFELERVARVVFLCQSPVGQEAGFMTEIVRVVVVDDSAYVRKVFKQMLSRSPFIEVVGAARDGEAALELCAELKPDVVTCDLNMPAIDGVAFVQAQMGRHPFPRFCRDGPAHADRLHRDVCREAQ
ncbi:MAG: response regulator [Vicinamibacterales bacterium]